MFFRVNFLSRLFVWTNGFCHMNNADGCKSTVLICISIRIYIPTIDEKKNWVELQWMAIFLAIYTILNLQTVPTENELPTIQPAKEIDFWSFRGVWLAKHIQNTLRFSFAALYQCHWIFFYWLGLAFGAHNATAKTSIVHKKFRIPNLYFTPFPSVCLESF